MLSVVLAEVVAEVLARRPTGRIPGRNLISKWEEGEVDGWRSWPARPSHRAPSRILTAKTGDRARVTDGRDRRRLFKERRIIGRGELWVPRFHPAARQRVHSRRRPFILPPSATAPSLAAARVSVQQQRQRCRQSARAPARWASPPNGAVLRRGLPSRARALRAAGWCCSVSPAQRPCYARPRGRG